jgi:hypothetical protein
MDVALDRIEIIVEWVPVARGGHWQTTFILSSLLFGI